MNALKKHMNENSFQFTQGETDGNFKLKFT